jgi:hypothetical protein
MHLQYFYMQGSYEAVIFSLSFFGKAVLEGLVKFSNLCLAIIANYKCYIIPANF